MPQTHLPLEVELLYETMPCNAMRVAQEPKTPAPHPCAYFRQWGTYHSFDYIIDGPQPKPGIPTRVKYVGRAPLIPEALSGCRKAPIVGVGINPNLPGWARSKRGALNPSFDDYRQYAHYFRYRSTDKLIVKGQAYLDAGGGPHDTPFSNFELNIAPDVEGNRLVEAELDTQTFYRDYQELLRDLAEQMHWANARLSVGEDLAYMNMVACPSARWTTGPIPGEPDLPPMTTAQRDGIVHECYRERRYFLRQLVQSLPRVLLIISQSTAGVFLGEMAGRFTQGNPQAGEDVRDLLDRDIRLRYGTLPDGSDLEAKVIFSPHFTGTPAAFAQFRPKVLAHLVSAAQEGVLTFNQTTKHLGRSRGACVFCPMLEVGPCDYEDELEPVSLQPRFFAVGASNAQIKAEKDTQLNLLAQIEPTARPPIREIWAAAEERVPVPEQGAIEP
jgi:hypothetical protein